MPGHATCVDSVFVFAIEVSCAADCDTFCRYTGIPTGRLSERVVTSAGVLTVYHHNNALHDVHFDAGTLMCVLHSSIYGLYPCSKQVYHEPSVQ